MSLVHHFVERSTPHFYAADVTGLAVIIGSYVGLLQGIFGIMATAAALTWYGVQIYEWFEKRRTVRRQFEESAKRVAAKNETST